MSGRLEGVAHQRATDRHIDQSKRGGLEADKAREQCINRGARDPDVELTGGERVTASPALRRADRQHDREQACIEECQAVQSEATPFDHLP